MNRDKPFEIGAIWSSKNFGDFVITDILEKEKGKNRNIIVRFLTKNIFDFYTTTIVRIDHAKDGIVVDYYQPNICNVACRGYAVTQINGVRLKEYEIWHNIIYRCYDHNNTSYDRYGGKGVKTCKRWLCYEYFYNDLPSIPGYELWKNNPENYHLDKDSLQQNIPINNRIYSPETCKFITRLENSLLVDKSPLSGYRGVILIDRGFGKTYAVQVAGKNFGVYKNPIAAANMYNMIGRSIGYPEYCLNNVPYMDALEIYKYRSKPVKNSNGKYIMATKFPHI